MSNILLEPAFAMGFACCIGLIAAGLLLFLLFAPSIEGTDHWRPTQPRRQWRGVFGALRAAAIRFIRRWALRLGGFAAVSAFWLLLFATALTPQP